MCAYICIFTYIDVYVYLHTHTHTHIYTYICIHTHTYTYKLLNHDFMGNANQKTTTDTHKKEKATQTQH